MSYIRKNNIKAVLATVTAIPCAYTTITTTNTSDVSWIPKIVRKEIMKCVFTRNIETSSLGEKHKYIENPILERDIHNCIQEQSGGVKIIWAPHGTGKTTTVRHVLNSECNGGKISGVLTLIPPVRPVGVGEWFMNELKFLGFETLTKYDQLSSLLHTSHEKPYVIVIDQFDNLDFDENLRRFIKVTAEDSSLHKNYIVIVICTDAAKVSTMQKWNGGVKIRPINDEFIAYKWNVTQIEKWIEHNLKEHPTINVKKNKVHFDKFTESAVVAGTPDFLITNSFSLDNQSIHEIENSWINSSNYINKTWIIGQQLLSSRYSQSKWWWR